MGKIILSGYMGSGKSSVAKRLQEKMGLSLHDLDQTIETSTQHSIAELFAQKGEIYFRKLEHEILKELLRQPQPFILSLGGGTPCYANNHELLQANGIHWVYLKASPETLLDRIANDKTERPLLSGKKHSELKDFIAQHLFERSSFYNLAPYKVSTDGKTPDEIANEIILLLA
ncbi:Shikimate kinase [Flavobacterium longum]|uniref:shikimate kinase n=1 Tax=Flavobacterium longum TaxID=1299340 RepID=UPI0039EC254D